MLELGSGAFRICGSPVPSSHDSRLAHARGRHEVRDERLRVSCSGRIVVMTANFNASGEWVGLGWTLLLSRWAARISSPLCGRHCVPPLRRLAGASPAGVCRCCRCCRSKPKPTRHRAWRTSTMTWAGAAMTPPSGVALVSAEPAE